MPKTLILTILIGYLLGSIPFTQIAARLVKGIDLRSVGSKNVGGMNTIESVGLGWGIVTGILDVLKGAAALYLAEKLGASYPANLWAGLAAIAGHNWPIWLKFRGGKGIATTIGLSAYLAFPETLIGFIIGTAIYFFSRRNVILAALISFLLIPGLMLLWRRPPQSPAVVLIAFLIMIAATLPGALEVIRKPGGTRGFFDNPKQAYDKNKDQDQS